MTNPSPSPSLFAPNSPVPLPLLKYLLASFLSALPGYETASPAEKPELAQAGMLMLAAFNPQDPGQAMLAAAAITAQVNGGQCFHLAGTPDLPEHLAHRYFALGASLMRCHESCLRRLQQVQRLAAQPAEVPAAHAVPPSAPPQPRPTVPVVAAPPPAPPQPRPPAESPDRRLDPMPSENAAPAQSRPPYADRPAPPHADTAPRSVVRFPHPGEPEAIRAMTAAAAKEAVARALRTPPPARA